MRWDFRVEEGERPDGGGRPAYVDRAGRWIGDGLASGRWRAWVAEAGGEAVGQVFLQLVERFPRIEGGEAGPVGYLTSFYVRPAWRGRGAGRALLDAAVAWARGRGVEAIVVWPSERSAPLYLRAGFGHPGQLLEHRFGRP
jgi:GNAT superfamily N-acetyltransferase